MTRPDILLRDLNDAAKRVWNHDKECFGVAPRYLAKLAIANANLPERLAAGGKVSPAIEKKLRAFMKREVGKKNLAARSRRRKLVNARGISQ